MVLNLDLNSPPMEENLLAEGNSNSSNTHQGSVVIDVNMEEAVIPIDVEATDDDDDVQLLYSMPSFLQGWNRSRRNQIQQAVEVPPGQSGFIVEDPVTALSLNSFNSHGRILGGEKVVDCEFYSSLERHYATEQKKNVSSSSQTSATLPLSPPPKEFVFTCPVCLSELTAPCSTKCGHIFCQSCITLSMQKRKQCPTCRKKLTVRSFHRVYLPSAD